MRVRAQFHQLLATLLALALPAAAAPVMYGGLSNFDVVNDTGSMARGFEIELMGVQSSDVLYTFGTPGPGSDPSTWYIRYGDPTIVPITGGVIVRYAATWTGSAWSAGTVYNAPPYTATSGHDCYAQSGVGSYATSGCEHFGVDLGAAAPLSTTYRWLVENPASSGSLQAFGSTVTIPAPLWKVTPPASPASQPAVAAVIAAPPAPAPQEGQEPQWGEPIWMKVYVTELADPVDLRDLVHGNAAVPSEPDEVEIEWILLQTPPGGEVEQESGGEIAAGNEAVSRRYEFYRYIGAVNADDGEALCNDAAQCLDAIGDFIGGQNAAFNLAVAEPVPAAPEPETWTLVAVAITALAVARRRSRRLS